jgi:ketosteroid isomerase-like protein
VSPKNLEQIHALYDAMNRKDLAAVERLAEEYPDHVWRNAPDMPESATRVGTESALSYVADLFETFDQLHTSVRDVIDLGPAGAIFVVRHRVRGAASGAEVERDEVHLWRTLDDRVVGMEEFLTVDEARAAAA